MQSFSNKDIRKMLIITIITGTFFGALYFIIVDSHMLRAPEFLSLEVFQQLRMFQGYRNSTKTGENNRIITLNLTSDIFIRKRKAEITKPSELARDLNEITEMPSISPVKLRNETSLLQKSAPSKTNGKMIQTEKCKFDKKILGPVHVDVTSIDLAKLKKKELDFVLPGGQWSPTDCVPREELAVVIPYRNREEHLGIFLRHMHKLLQQQKLKYRIFVIEQDDEYKFNRGKLMNVGFKEALLRHPFKCFAFHDIDLLPEDSRNDYGCPGSPRHMSVAIDKFDYELLYDELFGGVEMFKTTDYQKVNGFSNSFWGWGGEDDNLYFRVTNLFSVNISRPAIPIGRYKMLKHVSSEASADDSRFDVLQMSKNMDYVKSDGLSNLQYKVVKSLDLPLFTLIKVDLNKHEDRLMGVNEYL